MTTPGTCPTCGRDLAADKRADEHFRNAIAPLVHRRYNTLRISTILISLAALYFLFRATLPGAHPLAFLLPAVLLLLLLGLHLTESRCPHCRQWVFLLGRPERCSGCKGRLV